MCTKRQETLNKRILRDYAINLLYNHCKKTGITETITDTSDLYTILITNPTYYEIRNENGFIKLLNSIDVNSLNLELIEKIEDTL